MFGMDRRTDGQLDTSSPLPVTSSSLPVHLGTIGGHMRHHSYSLPKKLTFAKFAHGRTDGKKVTSKVPFRINARELKDSQKLESLFIFYKEGV